VDRAQGAAVILAPDLINGAVEILFKAPVF
jgi:hypothetical protein